MIPFNAFKFSQNCLFYLIMYQTPTKCHFSLRPQSILVVGNKEKPKETEQRKENVVNYSKACWIKLDNNDNVVIVSFVIILVLFGFRNPNSSLMPV